MTFRKSKAIQFHLLVSTCALVISACSVGHSGARYNHDHAYQTEYQNQITASRYGTHALRQSCYSATAGCPGLVYYQPAGILPQSVETYIASPHRVSDPAQAAPTTVQLPPSHSTLSLSASTASPYSTPVNCPAGTTLQPDGTCLTVEYPMDQGSLSPSPSPSTTPLAYTTPDYVFPNYDPVRK